MHGWEFNVTARQRLGLQEVREGGNPRQRHVPNRITGQGDGMLTEGPHENFALDTETLEVEYLKEADWDVDTCTPSRAKLESLGLGDIAEMIHA